ncbi:L-carnitine dehydrogenase [Colletotrichum spinosum]|uniref:L-gulonate 3-dehydrogenase n=1 Tax=Colletotrichum spinosum TaxID=1347390 RepID=A0A4R8QT99_9PEZI|nr:L-carnitine dehydrogenase [Colletotrichum spinosum]
MSSIQKVAIIGCGSIGASWAALFLAQGLTVTAFDINPSAETFLKNLVTDALPVLSSLGLLNNTDANVTDILFTTNLEEALDGADFVQENGPEKLDFKRRLFNDMAALTRRDTIIATSSSGLTCSSVQEGMQPSSHPERCVVGHPFNPPHLIPLVEVVGGAQTSTSTVDKTMQFYESMGKKPVHVKKEVVGHVANRLQAALVREIMYLLQQDVVNVEDIDNAMSYGPGLRWGVMGPSLLLHLGGGEGGVKHMADHLLGPLMTWYAPKDPEVNDELKQKWVDGTMQGVAGRDYRQLAKQRDEELVRLLNIRKEWDGYAESRKSISN